MKCRVICSQHLSTAVFVDLVGICRVHLFSFTPVVHYTGYQPIFSDPMTVTVRAVSILITT